MAEQKSPAEELARFRESLEEVLLVVERFAPQCATPEELMGVLRLGLENDAQLRFLLGRLKGK